MNNKDLKKTIQYAQNISVLFIEDDPIVQKQTLKLLGNFFKNITYTDDGQKGLDLYQKSIEEKNKPFDLVLSDINLPKLDGITLSEQILKINPDQIIVIISAHTDTNRLLKLINVGIYKFLQKPLDYDSFLSTMMSTISKIKDLSEQSVGIENIKHKNKKLNVLIETDNLTNIKNRVYADKFLENKIKMFKTDEFISISFIDIDNFKNINDTYGHLIGDSILIEFSQLIANSIRRRDFIARWGGEEFIILFKDCNLKECQERSEEIRQIIENFNFKNKMKITASFGTAQLKKDDSIESLIYRADMNLYKSKTTGKNKVT